MSCFDTLLIRCPTCKQEHEEQTKAGACQMKVYRLDDRKIPLSIVGSVVGWSMICQNCEARFTVKCVQEPKYEVRLLPDEEIEDLSD